MNPLNNSNNNDKNLYDAFFAVSFAVPFVLPTSIRLKCITALDALSVNFMLLGSDAVKWSSLGCVWFEDPTGSGVTKMAGREASGQLFKLKALQNRSLHNQLFGSSGILEKKNITELEWMANMIFEFLTVPMEVKGISSLPVMGANGSLLLDFAGTARKVQIMTCARSATCRIALITGARLNALTTVGA